MSEKKILKSLIRSYGLNPEGVEKSKKAWKGKGTDQNNDVAIDFSVKGGFKSALVEIISQAKNVQLYAEELD